MKYDELPILGDTGNWGTIINNNFRTIETEIEKLYSNVNSIQSVIGSTMPYVDFRNDYHFVELHYFNYDGDKVTETKVHNVDVKDISKGSWILFYFSKERNIFVNGKIENTEIPTAYYIYNGSEWDRQLPLFLASYVVDVYRWNDRNDKICLTDKNTSSSENAVSFFDLDLKRGDFLVRTQTFGSIYNSKYASTDFKLYPPMGEYFKPIINQGEPYKLKFEQVDYVTWFISGTQEEGSNLYTLTYTLPSLGLGVCNVFKILKRGENNYYYEINGERPSNDKDYINITDSELTIRAAFSKEQTGVFYPYVQFYLNRSPMLISHQVLINNDNTSQAQYEIVVDISNLPLSKTLTCVVSIINQVEVEQVKADE